jgi:hypothetical protein
LQRYDNILNVVSVTYGKDANKVKAKSAANQQIMKYRSLYPMEKNKRGYGKRDENQTQQ